MDNTLKGMLDIALIKSRYTNGISRGVYNGQNILVTNGTQHITENCIVRFGYKTNNVSFITSQVPDNFTVLPANKYVLLGIWEKYMQKSNKYPTLNEINKYYDPHDMPQAIFLTEAKWDRAAIQPKGVWNIGKDYSTIIAKKLPNPHRSSRIIICETKEQILEVNQELVNQDLIGIVMEALR